jgi:muramidase (phage lysozyme)
VIDFKPFLSLVAYSEGTSTHPLTRNDGYDVIVTGVDGPEIFFDYSDHPFAMRAAKLIRHHPMLLSRAAGRYQLLYRYWLLYKQVLHLPDFSPASQDAVAIRQITERGAHLDIEKGDIEQAIHLCSNIWASFPGNNYGQGGKSMADLVDVYKESGQSDSA